MFQIMPTMKIQEKIIAVETMTSILTKQFLKSEKNL
jgi:hypothetical protein